MQNESSEIVVDEEIEKNIHDEDEQILEDYSDEIGDNEGITEIPKTVILPNITTHTEKSATSQPDSVTSASTSSITFVVKDSKKGENDEIDKNNVILEETMTIQNETSEIVIDKEMEKNIHGESLQILDDISDKVGDNEGAVTKIPKTVILPNITTHTENTQTNIIVNLETFDDIVPQDSTNVQAIQVS